MYIQTSISFLIHNPIIKITIRGASINISNVSTVHDKDYFNTAREYCGESFIFWKIRFTTYNINNIVTTLDSQRRVGM